MAQFNINELESPKLKLLGKPAAKRGREAMTLSPPLSSPTQEIPPPQEQEQSYDVNATGETAVLSSPDHDTSRDSPKVVSCLTCRC